MLTLAFDTATSQATSALLLDGDVLGERVGSTRTLLRDLEALLDDAGHELGDVDRLVVGVGPGSFTGARMGVATARGLAFSRDLPVAGVSTLDALAASGAVPVIDAKRGEVFVPGPSAIAPEALRLETGTTCVGDGAVRYRSVLVAAGLRVPPDEDPRHRPRASVHARLAERFEPAEALEPVYVRAPDAVQAR